MMNNTMHPRTRVIIFRNCGDCRMYLCADGTLSGNREHAQEHWASQFDAIVAENPILTGYNCVPGMEVVTPAGDAHFGQVAGHCDERWM